MKVIFLGTGTSQGIPVIACNCAVCTSTDSKDKRLRSSILVEDNNLTFVIDTGPDFRQQMLRAKVKRLDAVLFTHKHKDHTAGLDDVRAFNFRQAQAMPIYADALTLSGIEQEFSYIFEDNKYPGIPQLEIHIIDHRPFYLRDLLITPVPVLHHKMPVLGFRIHNFAYVTDANYIPPSSMELLQNLDILVLNALRHEKHISHFTVSEAIEIIQLLKPKKAYLTHISHLLGKHEEENRKLPPNIELAYDELELVI
ncbi:MAG: MBL fold metallo-hydrolase [Bacteroidia bacterium]|nr:MBL fold metallo-hydrolase [Bacteroidia bacterium]MDW8157825.1 MBL fold metallo-hydrolase [Bacteroidia bacterium]